MKLNQFIRKIKTRIWFSVYYGRYQKTKLKDKWVFLESRSGSDMAGNILGIARELSSDPRYKDLKLCIPARPETAENISLMLKKYNIRCFKFVREESLRYYKYLSRCKYLINDTSFPRRFIKKEGQIILNTWHGTPLKNMGRYVDGEVHAMGNVMRNLIFSDFLLFPNEYMKEKMVDAYMLQNLCKATILNEGYPRNSVFFDKEKRASLRRELGIDDKQVLVYMPTWRGHVNQYDQESATAEMEAFLHEIDGRLNDGQLLYVKYHPLMKLVIDDSSYKHIRAFPSGYEYYEVLNTADTLITDYSSVFYDFANSGQKIILYCYDKEEYFSGRGVYVSLDEFPFPQTETIDELIEEIGKPKNYDDTEFRNRYCTYDSKDAVKRICERVILGEKVTNEEKLEPNGKENVLIYSGNLQKNGITTALLSLLEKIDLSKYNYYISFREKSLTYDPYRTLVLPKETGVIPISYEMAFDFKTSRAYKALTKRGSERAKKNMLTAYRREIKRHFYGIDFRHVIQFNGYENNIIGLMTAFECKKSIFVHSDMLHEIETRNNQNRNLLHWVYSICDNVVTVSDDVVEPTYIISGRKDNIKVISNFHDHEGIVARGELPIEFQKDTDIFCPHVDGASHILDSEGFKFITIGRFSPEKGHIRLIEAFEIFHKKYPDSKLIIIGGLGGLYNATVKKVRESECWEDVLLIRSMANPMPILKKCDLFILSSLYEGLGLVMLEADSLGVPVFSTNVKGPAQFLNKHNGYLVDDSMEGILQGMYDFADGKIKTMNVDYEERNREILKKIESII